MRLHRSLPRILLMPALLRGACPPESLEGRYRKALDQAASWMVRDGKLHIAMALDTGVLRFAPAPR